MTTQKEIYDKYPDMFRQKDLPMDQTCMCWGLECGEGWYDLIDRACEQIEWVLRAVNSTPQNKGSVEFEQIKEKFGTLRLYYSTKNLNETERDIIDSITSYAEHVSSYTCEECGTTLARTSVGGWLRTMCDKHHSEHDQKLLDDYDDWKDLFFENLGPTRFDRFKWWLKNRVRTVKHWMKRA